MLSFSLSLYARSVNKVITIVNHSMTPIQFHVTDSHHVVSTELSTDGEVPANNRKVNRTVIDDDAGSPWIHLDLLVNNEKILKTTIHFYQDRVDYQQINAHFFISTEYSQSGMILHILSDGF